jgi:hypothetical protein
MGPRGEGWWPEGHDGESSERKQSGEEEGGRRERRPPATGPAGKPPRGLASQGQPRVASRYSLFVGLAFVALVSLAVLNAIRTEESGILGANAGERGAALAEFAVPDARSDAGGDANVAQDDCESGRNPCPEDDVRAPACRIGAPDALRVCDFFSRPLAISFWFTRGGDCLASQDAFDAVSRGPLGERVGFLSINVLDDRDDVRELIAARGWEVPVGHDADGAVSNLYRVGVCPSVLLAYPGGILHRAAIKPGNFTVAELEGRVRGLLRASRARERR